MSFNQRKTILILLSSLFALGIGGYLTINTLAPKLVYTINRTDAGSSPEAPLEIRNKGDVSKETGDESAASLSDGVIKHKNYEVDFSTKFIEKKGKIVSAKLNRGVSLKAAWSFIEFSQDLNVVLKGDSSEVDEDMSYLYELSGSIVNLRPQFYKLRIIDEFGNLIDERAFDLGK